MAKERNPRYVGNESGKSSKKWFTPSDRPHPHTGDGVTSRKPGSLVGRALKVIFRDAKGKKLK